MIPDMIAEWIDEDVLPSKADGEHTAEQIYEECYEECEDGIDDEKEGIYRYEYGNYNTQLIDSWMVLKHHKNLFVEYVQNAFDSWEESE